MEPIQWHRRAVLMAMASLTALPLTPLDAFAKATTYPFALGVASGDPSRDGCVLWTRLVGPAGAPLQAAAIRVRFEVAADEAFRRIVLRGSTLASPERAHSVHVELAGLQPGRQYWYRFHALGATSQTGRTRTVPVHAERLRIALTSCQHWELGWFGGYRGLLAADPDVIFQVGDYIYESRYPDQPAVRSFGAPEPTDLAAYRQRHALYRNDPDLRAAHAAVPWVVTWDDHEVLNDYAGLANREGLPPAQFARRRAAAYQAYFEHMPVRPSAWLAGGEPRLYRALDWADLASISVLDTRQYRSAPPCAPPDQARNVRVTGCADLLRPDRSIVGAAQERWLADRLAGESRPWTVITQQVFFAPLALDAAGNSSWSDQWDGYAANRQRVLQQLSQPVVSNAVILSGDIHSFWANELRSELKDPRSALVASEIVTSALAAQSPPTGHFGDALANNPHIRFSDTTHSGYTLMDIDRRQMTASMFAIDRTQQRPAPQRLARIVHESGGDRLLIDQ